MTRTADELLLLIAEYRAGLETEMVLLRRLRSLSTHQAEAARDGDATVLTQCTEQRDRVMASLVSVEHGLKPIRQVLTDARDLLAEVPEFREVAAQHRVAGDLVAGLVASDRDALEALKEAEHARQFAARGLEQGESTLAAYRRVVAPPTSGATLVDRKG